MRLMLTAVFVAIATFAPSATSALAVGAGVDEYTVRSASASGHNHTSAAPTAHPENLSAQAQQALKGQPDARDLTKIATAPELGAPGLTAPASASTDDPSAGQAAFDALGAGGWAAVIAMLGLGAGVIFLARRRGQGV